MKCATFEEHSSLCVVYFRFSGTIFPVSMIDGEGKISDILIISSVQEKVYLKTGF